MTENIIDESKQKASLSGKLVAGMSRHKLKVKAAIAAILLLSAWFPITPAESASPAGWQQMNPPTSPSARINPSMVYDISLDRIILFGGETLEGDNGETWIYNLNSNSWTMMQPVQSPSPREGAMAYDIGSNRVILFGGSFTDFGASGGTFSSGAVGALNDTWSYDLKTNTWTNMAPATAPPARWDHSMAYDAQSDRVILTGGHDRNTQYLDTWAYDLESNTWTNLKPLQAPAIIGLGDTAYDQKSDKVIQFGGLSGLLTDTGRTWAYDFHANSWTDRSPPSGPRARYFLAMAYDTESDRVILFGGGSIIQGSPAFGDTWSYDYNSNVWTRLYPTTTPSARMRHGMAYDIESHRVVMFGGQGCGGARRCSTFNAETWIFDFNGVSSVQTTGTTSTTSTTSTTNPTSMTTTTNTSTSSATTAPTTTTQSTTTTTVATTPTLTTTSSVSSTTTTSSGGGGISEFPYQLLALSAFTFLVVTSYLLVRRSRTSGGLVGQSQRKAIGG